MTDHDWTTQRVLELLVRVPNSALDEIVLKCPDLTWNQIFLVIDRLSREGDIQLIPHGRGNYTVRLSRTQEPSVENRAVA